MKRSPEGYNRHHVYYDRVSYLASNIGSLLRSMPGGILTLPETDHKELHNTCSPLPVPSASLGKIMIASFVNSEYENRYDQFQEMREKVWSIAENRDSRLSDEAFIFALNFEDQAQFFGNVIRTN